MSPLKHQFTRIRSLATTFLVAGTIGLAAAATGLAGDDITVKLTASKVAAAKAGEKLIPADVARPGEVIQYEAVYRNETKREVKGLEATVPIPAGLELVPDTALPASALASKNGADFAAMPLMAAPAGAAKSVPVPLAEYRALRWTIPQLAPGAEATVKLRARVLTNQPPKKLNP